MKIKPGKGTSKYGKGIEINLTGCEVAAAINLYLVSQGVNVYGPRTMRVNGAQIESGYVYVDPSGFVIKKGKRISGMTGKKEKTK